MWITINCGKFWERWESQTIWPASWETCMQVRKQQLELDMEQQTHSKLGKEYAMAIYCHPVYLTYIEYIMWNARLDESQDGIKISGRNINNLRYTDESTLMAETKEELKRILMKVKEESEKAGLTFKKQRSWHLVLSFHGKLVRKKIQTDRLYIPGLQNHCIWWLQPWN